MKNNKVENTSQEITLKNLQIHVNDLVESVMYVDEAAIKALFRKSFSCSVR